MKKIILISMISIFAKLGFGFPDTKVKISEITTDVQFLNLLENYYLLGSKIDTKEKLTKLQDILADSEITEAELDSYVYLLGFSNKEELATFNKNQKELLDAIDKKYNFNSLEETKKKDFLNIAYKNIFSTKPELLGRYPEDKCRDSYVNCIVGVSAQAAIMHLGCAGLDLTIIGGIICHGAAIAYQVSGNNGCFDTYQNCKGIV